MEDIRMEDFYWRYQKEDDMEEVEKDVKRKKRRRYANWLKWARRILMVELAVILWEGMFQFGHLVRGYSSVGGESIALLALIGYSAWQLHKIIK